eukprot:PhM_4_TR11891/c0_g1_i1/m.42719
MYISSQAQRVCLGVCIIAVLLLYLSWSSPVDVPTYMPSAQPRPSGTTVKVEEHLTEPPRPVSTPSSPMIFDVEPSTAAPVVDDASVLWHTHYVTMNPLYSFYGLTNQLICYAAALAYGMSAQRNVLFPVNQTASAYELFDLTETQRRLPRGATIAYPANVTGLGKATSMNKKSLFLPEREFYRSLKAKDVRWTMSTIYSRSRKYRFVRHHNFFMRYPWLPQDHPNDEAVLFRAFVPCRAVREYSAVLLNILGGAERVLVLHLRVEADGALIRPKGARVPSANQLRTFLRNTIRPLALEVRATTVYICSGAMPETYAAVLEEVSGDGSGVRYRHKFEAGLAPRLPTLPKAVGHQRDKKQSTQDHYASLADLVVLSRARVAVVTHFSSLKYSVLAWRCRDRKSTGVHTIRIADDGTVQEPVYFDCAHVTKGWVGHQNPLWPH